MLLDMVKFLPFVVTKETGCRDNADVCDDC